MTSSIEPQYHVVVVDGDIEVSVIENNRHIFERANLRLATTETTARLIRDKGYSVTVFDKQNTIHEMGIQQAVRSLFSQWKAQFTDVFEGYNLAQLSENFFSYRVIGDWLHVLSWVFQLVQNLNRKGLNVFVFSKTQNVLKAFLAVAESLGVLIEVQGDKNFKQKKTRKYLFFVRDFVVRYFGAKLNNIINILQYRPRRTRTVAFIHTIPEFSFYKKLSSAFEKEGVPISVARALVGREIWVSGPLFMLDSFLSLRGLLKLVRWRRRFSAQFKSLSASGFSGSFCFKGVSLYNIVKDDLWRFYQADLPSLIKSILCAERFFDKSPTNCVLFTTTWNVYEQGVLEVARRRGILSIQIMHALLEGPSSVFSETVNSPAADYYLVWGDYYKRQIDAFKRHTTVISVGYPLMEEILSREVVPIEVDNDLLILPSPYSERHLKYFIELIAAAVSRFPKLRCVVKMHPSQPESQAEMYRGVLKKYGVNCSVLTHANLDNLMRRSRLVVQTQSTVAMEAIIRDLPVVNIALSAEDSFSSEWGNDKAIISVRSVDEMVDCIEKVVITRDSSYLTALKEARQCFQISHFLPAGFSAARSKETLARYVGDIIAGKMGKENVYGHEV